MATQTLVRTLLIAAAFAPCSGVWLPAQAPPPGALTQQQRADQLFNAGKHGSALRIYEALAEETPCAITHFKAGMCHKLLGAAPKALDCARKAIELQPELLPALVLAVEVVDEADAALSLAGLITEHVEADGRAFEQVILALQRHEQMDKALAIAQQAIVKFADDEPLHYAAAELALAVKRLPLAEKCYAALTRINPADPRALESLGRVQSFQGKKSEARATYERTLEVNPSNLVVRRELIGLMVDAEAPPEQVELQRRYLDYYERVHAAHRAGAKPK